MFRLDIPQSEVTAAMRSTQSLCAFAKRYGQSLDWLIDGNVSCMIMDRVHAAGWWRKGAA